MKQSILKKNYSKGFSLVELLLVLGIISIMASIVINSFSNAAQDSRNVIARQQQATLQSAVNNWVASQIGGYENPDPNNPEFVIPVSYTHLTLPTILLV